MEAASRGETPDGTDRGVDDEHAQRRSQDTPSGTERRRHTRSAVNLPITIRILIEEQTFSPFSFDGTCENISRSGALTTVRDMTQSAYRQFIQRPRYIRLVFKAQDPDEPLTLFGKLVWYDYNSDVSPALCKLGIKFEPMKDEVIERLEGYLESAAREGEAMP